jgi:hypothetical protein
MLSKPSQHVQSQGAQTAFAQASKMLKQQLLPSANHLQSQQAQEHKVGHRPRGNALF